MGPTRHKILHELTDVFPVEYCPHMSTWGLLSNSLSVRGGEWNQPNIYVCSRGLSLVWYRRLRPSTTAAVASS